MEPEKPAGPARTWIWPVAIGALVVVIVILVALLLAPRNAVPTATSTPTPSSTPTDAPTPPPTTPPAPGAPSITDEDHALIAAAISSGDTGALVPYLPEQTMVILCASEAYGLQTPEEVQSDVGAFLADAHGPWDFAVPAATVDDYRAGSYAEYFPEGGLVGRSADSWIIAFEFAEAQISDIFLCPSEVIILE